MGGFRKRIAHGLQQRKLLADFDSLDVEILRENRRTLEHYRTKLFFTYQLDCPYAVYFVKNQKINFSHDFSCLESRPIFWDQVPCCATNN